MISIGSCNKISLIALIWLLLAAVLAWFNHRIPQSQRALFKARAVLKKAKQEQDVANALSLYLQLKYDIHTASCPVRQVQEELRKHKCPEEYILHFGVLWQQLEAVRFAPAAHKKDFPELIEQASHLLSQLDKGARK